MANLQSDASFSTKDLCSKEMSKIIVPLHVMPECDVTSSSFGVDKRTVWKRVQKSTETQMFLPKLLHEDLIKFVVKYIYKDKLGTTLTKMRAQKWENMKNRKAQTFARTGIGLDSNFYGNERVMYYANMLLNFQHPVSSICPINHRYQILNGICMPMIHSKSPSLDEVVKRVNHNLQADNTDIQISKTTMAIILVMRMNLMINCLSESNSTKHLLSLFI